LSAANALGKVYRSAATRVDRTCSSWVSDPRAIERSATLAAARAQNPERFSTAADPKILALSGTTWINKPAEHEEKEPEPKLAA
jgi:hypothetical protein